MKYFVLAAALLLAPPASAQVPVSEPAASVPVDPARLALAQVTIDFVWPLGTYARMMDASVEQMVESVVGSLFDMPMGDIVGDLPAKDGKPLDPEAANATMREAMAKVDPHFEERMRITNRVMSEEMVPIMTRLEPSVRDGLARALARKFTAPQLSEINGFFATPTGRAYGAESMMLWVDPEVMSAMARMMPEMLKDMPRIMEKVQAATAHLPQPRPSRQEGSRRDRRRR